jgi:NADPH:quinone reductase
MMASGAKALARNLIPWGPRVRLYTITGMRKRHPDWFKEDLGHLFRLLELESLAVRIARRIGFDELRAAHCDLERGGVSGKIILVPNQP